MNQLVNMQVLTMSSIALLSLVNSARLDADEKPVRHADFVARCRDELEGDHYEIFVVKNANKTETEALSLTPDQCKLVAMRESKSVRRQVLAFLKQSAPPAPSLPQTFADALRLAADQQEQIEQQQKVIALAAPKAEFVDRYVESNGLKGFRQVAKLLGIKENLFRSFLSDQKIMYQISGEWVPYANHIDAGRFEVKTGASDGGHAFNQAKFTAKGIAYVADLLRDSKKIEPEKALEVSA
jgi:phage antirepressor YoqD-like protein